MAITVQNPLSLDELKVTPLEYQTALELSRSSKTTADDSEAYWQLCRYYRGQIFDRSQVTSALQKMRGEWV